MVFFGGPIENPTTTPRQASYIGIRRISTGADNVLSQFSSTMAPSIRLSLTGMIMMTMTMNDDNDAGNCEGGEDGSDDGDDDDDDGNDDGSGNGDGDNHNGGNADETTTTTYNDDDEDHDGDDDDGDDKRKVTTNRCAREAR